jgi:uncharacterized protein YdeI (YjbR/CyaY-like superfamily)
MGKKDKAVDAYISKSADFAKPVLIHVRELMHKVCPDVEEKIRWGFPNFDYKDKPMTIMAAFKQHCTVGFWKSSLIKGVEKKLGKNARIKSFKDLPSDKELSAFIKEAMKINEQGIKVPKKIKSADEKELIVPDYFLKVLSKNKKALQVFEKSSYSYKKEYIDWISQAKTEETRNRRIETALEWIAEGKGRNWKYERK